MKKILVVEDNYVNAHVVKKNFEHRYEMDFCSDGDSALETILTKYTEYSAVLLDLMLPGTDGITILKKLFERKVTDQIPIIIMSAYDNQKTVFDVYNYGAADIFHKPMQIEVAKKRIANLIELYESRKNMSIELMKTNMELKLSKDKISQNNEFLINALGSVVEFRSNESGNHIKRVKFITQILIESVYVYFPKYNLDIEDIDMIAQASSLHDVGKIAIPDSILNKPGKLEDFEFAEMKKHPIYGCEILENFKQTDNKFYTYCYNICRWHHEKYDGNGYPDKLDGDEIPIYCQAVAVADCFDALISKRVYKPQYSFDEAFSMIKNGECGLFGADIMYCFDKCKDKLLELTMSNLYD